MGHNAAQRVDQVLSVLQSHGDRGYIGEPVSQLEHALQCAALAQQAKAATHEVLAGLLHDVGHMVAPPGAAEMAGLGILHHEHIGASWLAELGVNAAVCTLVASHVAAKRFLAKRKPGYYEALSEASRGTLSFQGGPMSEAEAVQFEADSSFAAKVRLRMWDEAAKRTDWSVPDLDSYRALLCEHVR